MSANMCNTFEHQRITKNTSKTKAMSVKNDAFVKEKHTHKNLKVKKKGMKNHQI